MDPNAGIPKRAQPKREGVEQELPDEQVAPSREQLSDETTMVEPQRGGTAETGEDEDLPGKAGARGTARSPDRTTV